MKATNHFQSNMRIYMTLTGILVGLVTVGVVNGNGKDCSWSQKGARLFHLST
jgi:hypothetical protein